ncbi:protein-L-isoaspartate O-methyltransferase family protein [Roseococcus sp.]|uniref:protein-L-isoaspartate O-methyltransferase family protein n=1 Tax=Roseococcus sp. TaxID=2109646 RepID=UPI003BAD6A04
MAQSLVTELPQVAEDFSRARRFMVDGQLAPNGITDPLLLGAMGEIPREIFLPPALRHRAYADDAVPLGNGRAMLSPMVLAKMIQLALPQPGERALVLGAGAGYGAAVLARMGLKVMAVESEAELAARSEAAFGFGLHENRPVMTVADAKAGLPAGAPFRLIVIEGAVQKVPAALTTQLGEGGRLLVIRREPGQVGRILMIRKLGGGLTEVAGPDAAGPLLAEFAPAPGFVF